MPVTLYEHQKAAIEKLRSGSILYAGVGTGKSRTALGYYYFKECKGKLKVNGVGGYSKPKTPKNLYVITTAKKRDSGEWFEESGMFLIGDELKMTVDSWNNIEKYLMVKDAFFIFDEQRAVGNGAWANAFIKIAKKNHWIMLTATPGDTWSDYIPVFIANGFYKNRTEFARKHIEYNRFTLYPKIERYINCGRLVELKNRILVKMVCTKHTIAHNEDVIVKHDESLFRKIIVERWNIFENRPIRDASDLCYAMRKLVNSSADRQACVADLMSKNKRCIIFYNFDYELNILRQLAEGLGVSSYEWNGHKHESIPNEDRWVYLVQYSAGSEGWNCVETNVIIFYSLSYSYKQMTQAAGRIDRLNTPYEDLYYYRIRSKSVIDMAILKALKNKRNFNESRYMDL